MASKFTLGLAACALTMCCATPSFAELKGDVIVFHAGSLSKPFSIIEKQFEALHPNVDIKREAGGSTKLARLISEVGKPADIMASADYMVIDNNLMPKFTEHNVRFATNQIVLCYTENSRFAKEVNVQNWFDILQRKDVVWGHADPNIDPCGYRSLMTLQLAEVFYKKPGLNKTLLDGRKKEWIRPKSVELISMLQSGNMDYAWEYQSVAEQHGLKYIKLDDKINLADFKNDEYYKQAVVKVTGKQPGTFIDRVGQSITYGVAMMKDSKNPEAAAAFLAFLLSPEHGMKVLQEQGQPVLAPSVVPSDAMLQAVPAQAREFVKVTK